MVDLKVIEGSGMGRKRERHECTGKGDIILPPVELSYDVLCQAKGMTRHQVNRAFQLLCLESHPLHETGIDAVCAVHDARHKLQAALTVERRIMVAALMPKFPKLARRLMGSMARKGHSWQRQT
jgi:hypothetical protein